MRARALSAAVAVTAILAATFPAPRTLAQQPPTPTVAPGYHAPRATPGAPAITGVTEQPFVGISLQDAVQMALLRNTNLAVSAGNVRIARFNVVAAKSPFDVQLHLQPSSSFQVTPPLNVFFSGPGETGAYRVFNPFCGCYTTTYAEGPGNIIQHVYSFTGGFSGQAVSGLTWNAGITRTRTYNNTIVNFFNPYYQSSLNLAADQPLLRNFGMNAAKRDVKMALVGSDESEAQTLSDASSTIAQVEDAYWNLVAAWRNVAIQEEALKEAVAVEQSNIRLARRGVAPPVLAIEAQNQASNFQNSLYSGLEYVSDLQNQLKYLILADSKDPVWSANLVPSSPAIELPSAGDLNEIVALAEQYRPEMQLARDQRKQADIEHAYAKNQELPQADLYVNYQSNGFAGVPQPAPSFEAESCAGIPNCPTPPPETQGKMGRATGNMWAWRYPTFNIAFIVSFPFQNRNARGMVESAEQAQQQADVTLEGVKQRIGAEARTALQAYQASLSRIYAARQSRESAEAVYASELRKFHAGASTTYLVLQRQLELEQSRGRELTAQTDLNKAVVELQRVEGTILSDNGVDFKTIGTKALVTSSP